MARSRGVRALTASAPLFGALGDPTRLGLVVRLCEQGPLSISRLTAGTDVTRQAITRHLRVLAKAGVVQGMRDGRASVWELQPRRLEEAQRYLAQISRQWDEAIVRLRAFVER
jgi:DNA-binding transcriptional ArsR family regulator